jgi:hypothetical protein
MLKDTYIPCLLQLFRQYDYDGAVPRSGAQNLEFLKIGSL